MIASAPSCLAASISATVVVSRATTPCSLRPIARMVCSMPMARSYAAASLSGVRTACGTYAAKQPAARPPRCIFGRSTRRVPSRNGSGPVGHGMSICVSRVSSPRCKVRASGARESFMVRHARRYRRDTEGVGSYKSGCCRRGPLLMPRALLLAAMALLIGGSAAAQTRPASEAIGSWVLSCPDTKTAPCQLRHRASMMQPGGAGGPSASLEVVHRGDLFVPVVTLRGISMQAALGGVLAVQSDVALRLDDLAWTELGCGLDGGAVICAPAGDAANAAAAELNAAHSALVRVRISIPGVTALPEQSHSFDLQQTAEAL